MNILIKSFVLHFSLALGVCSQLSAQSKFVLPYQHLKEYEGLYQYRNPPTLEIALSPKDSLIYAIINLGRYPLRPVAKDIFVNSTNDSIIFLRDTKGIVNGYIVKKDTFRLVNKNVFFPERMWYPRMVPDPKLYTYHY